MHIQHGRIIETVTIVVDFEGLSFKKHYHWPSIEIIKTVSLENKLCDNGVMYICSFSC